MKWIKYLFITLLFLLALPMWRLIDWAVIIWPQNYLLTPLLVFWSLFFIAWPLKLLFSRLHFVIVLTIPLLVGVMSWWITPLSNADISSPAASHCGISTYTGTLFPVKYIFTALHEDDLELRNQLCWMRKISLKNDVENLEEQLLKPAQKFRISLPMVLYLTYQSKGADAGKQMEFWTQQYSEEISKRKYDWWDWPYSSFIQWEYGILEDNWNNIQLEFIHES